MNKIHQPAMLVEVMQHLNVLSDHWYLDATFGRGGHTEAILQAGGKVLALDCDQEAVEYGRETFKNEVKSGRLILVKSNFTQLEQVAKANNLSRFSGILFDFGASSDQLLAPHRGFSFQANSSLDMRMDQELGVTAADLLNVLSVKQLTNLFRDLGGEIQAHAIAKAIKEQPEVPKTTEQLAKLVSQVKKVRNGKIHPATKVFQALRIAVNTELDNIEAGIPEAFKLLESRGRLVTLSFHEGEDRIAKTIFRYLKDKGLVNILTTKPIGPSNQEQMENPRARSCSLRAIERL